MFTRAYARGQWRKAWSFLTGKSHSLLDLQSIKQNCEINAHETIGTQTVQIEHIRGSEGRVHDFDHDFNPLVNCTRDRWLGIASALRHGRHLPAVILVQVGDLFFVRDGHHRISVAKAYGETFIEARVIVWQVEGPLPWDCPATLQNSSPMNQLRNFLSTNQSLIHLWNSISQHFMPGAGTPSLEQL